MTVLSVSSVVAKMPAFLNDTNLDYDYFSSIGNRTERGISRQSPARLEPRSEPEVILLRVVTAVRQHFSRVKTDTFGSNRYERNSRATESLLCRQFDESRQGATRGSTIRIDNQWSVSRFRLVQSLDHRTGTIPNRDVRARRRPNR